MKEQIVKPMQRDAPEYKSAAQNYTGIRPETKGIYNKLQNLFKGYIETALNLNDFISFNNLDMILNNNIVKFPEFEFYNYSELLEKDIENDTEELKDDLIKNNESYVLTDLLEIYYTGNYNENELLSFSIPEILQELEEAIEERANDLFYERNAEIYQYFIVPEYDAINYWNEYTNYPILYDPETDLYIIGITHYGMSWDYFSTSFKVRTYI